MLPGVRRGQERIKVAVSAAGEANVDGGIPTNERFAELAAVSHVTPKQTNSSSSCFQNSKSFLNGPGNNAAALVVPPPIGPLPENRKWRRRTRHCE
jgi:hypothetical protein